ncbi:hypothetical protein Lal_00027043 [Lupinus albus]|nr:hypothetical protein Lal_00027043 [Lupinus albus]
MALWKCMGFNTSGIFQASNPTEWIRYFGKDSEKQFLATFWWNWRNINIYSIEQQKEIWYLTTSFHQAIIDMEAIYTDHIQSHKIQRWVQWLRLNNDFIALNIDGSSLVNPGKAGYEGLLRDNMDLWISGFMGLVGISKNLHAELICPLYGLQLA